MKKDKYSKKTVNLLQKSSLQKIFILLFLFLVITFILSINFIPSKVVLKEGEVANKDIIAPKTVEFVDEKATEKLREEAAKSIREVYNLNLASIENADRETDLFFSDIKLLRDKYYTVEDNQPQKIPDTTPSPFPDDSTIHHDLQEIIERYSLEIEEITLLNLLKSDPTTTEEIEKNSRLSIRKIMQQGIKEEDIEEARKQLVRDISEISTNPYSAVIASEIGVHFIEPSLFLDIEATDNKRQDAVSAVKDVKSIIRKDQIIIRKGEIVTSEHTDKLTILGLQNPILHFENIIGLLLINFLLILLLGLYLYFYQKDIYESANKLILLSVLYATMVFIAKITGEISGYLIPIAFSSMLIALAIDFRLALWMTFIIGLNIGFIFLGEIDYILVAIIGGLISIFSIQKATQRSSLTRAGLLIAIVNIFSILALGLIHGHPSQIILENCMWGVLNGFVSAILTIGILPFLEGFFDITSSFRLMELSNPNQPLLKQLLVEAPGTYHHSVVVGNLAEAAAEEIGANALLARAGAYYHDVGKLKRPYFFSENQEAYKNTHDDLEPSLSALVIASHVKDGVEMAKKYRLPKSIIDILNQHHGTGLISYFFHRALQSNDSKSDDVKEENYRYAGPKPHSKEAGIILLADTLEAEARTLTNPTSSRIKNLTQNVINRNLENGQLDNCNLTLRDLNKIKDVFSRILTGMFHNRVEYPDEDLINKLKKDRYQSESTNQKSSEKANQSAESEKSPPDSHGNNGTNGGKRSKHSTD